MFVFGRNELEHLHANIFISLSQAIMTFSTAKLSETIFKNDIDILDIVTQIPATSLLTKQCRRQDRLSKSCESLSTMR